MPIPRTRPVVAYVLACSALLFVVLIAAACAAARQPDAVRPTLSSASTTAAGRILHVAPTGADDGSGAVDDPWRTVDHALRQLRAGDTLYLRGGSYVERVRNPPIRAGTAAAPIVVAAYPGERPVIEGILWLRGASHWTLDGINITWNQAGGAPDEHMVKFTDGVDWELRNAEVWGAQSFAAILVATSGGAEPARWRIGDSCIHDTQPSNRTNQDHLIYVNAGLQSGPGVIERNLLWGAHNGTGIKLGGPSPGTGGAAHVTVRDNTIHDVVQGVLIAGQSHRNTLEGNLITRMADGFSAIRGFRLSGEANVAHGNAAGDADALIRNDPGHRGISDGGENVFPVDPRYAQTGTCDGFRPTDELAAEYGHLADARRPALRLHGRNRVATAAAVAATSWIESDVAVLARADDPADALAGAGLAGAHGAPLLITPSHELPAIVLATLRDLNVQRVILLGGHAAIGPSVAADLTAAGVAVERVSGRSRAATAAAIADRLAPASGGIALLVRGSFPRHPERAWADALAVSGLAARRASGGTPWPVLLLDDGVPEPTWAALRRHTMASIRIAGGTGTVPHTVETALADNGYPAVRWAGASRYETSRIVADLDADAGPLIIATGANFPDGLAAGPLAAQLGGTLLLVAPHVDTATTEWVAARADRFDSLVVVGGPAAVPDDVVESIATAVDAGTLASIQRW